MNLAVFLTSALAIFADYALAQPVKYDQRQEGDLNVRTDVEDVVFVVVPPQDLVTAGMGLVAATAADLLRKSYGPIGPERIPMRTPPKLGFVALEKSPYKIDLEKAGFKVKKISHSGDPNRYNFHEGKNPTKSVFDVKQSVSTEAPEKTTVELMTEMIDEMQSTTENKTVKKVLKLEDIKKAAVEEPKKSMDEQKSVEEKKDEKLTTDTMKKSEQMKTKTEQTMVEEPPKVVGEGTKDGLDPTSILRLEGCGPDGRRNSAGKCIYEKIENTSNKATGQ